MLNHVRLSQIMNQLELGIIGCGSELHESLVGSRNWSVLCGVQLKYS